MSARRARPSFRAVVTNWRTYDAPFGAKLWMLARNNWTKLRRRSDCCGNTGEPGC